MTVLYLVEWPPGAVRIMLMDPVDGDDMEGSARYPTTWNRPVNLIIVPR